MKREQHRIELAISRLRSLHDGDRGVVDVVACGAQAIPALRQTTVRTRTERAVWGALPGRRSFGGARTVAAY